MIAERVMAAAYRVSRAAERLVDAEIAYDRTLGRLLDSVEHSSENERLQDEMKAAQQERDDALEALAAKFGKTWPT